LLRTWCWSSFWSAFWWPWSLSTGPAATGNNSAYAFLVTQVTVTGNSLFKTWLCFPRDPGHWSPCQMLQVTVCWRHDYAFRVTQVTVHRANCYR
jgi:hypothetical protein